MSWHLPLAFESRKPLAKMFGFYLICGFLVIVMCILRFHFLYPIHDFIRRLCEIQPQPFRVLPPLFKLLPRQREFPLHSVIAIVAIAKSFIIITLALFFAAFCPPLASSCLSRTAFPAIHYSLFTRMHFHSTITARF